MIGRNENVKNESEMLRKSITMPLTANVVSDLGLQAINLFQSLVLIRFESWSQRVFCNMPFLTLKISLYILINETHQMSQTKFTFAHNSN